MGNCSRNIVHGSFILCLHQIPLEECQGPFEFPSSRLGTVCFLTKLLPKYTHVHVSHHGGLEVNKVSELQ